MTPQGNASTLSVKFGTLRVQSFCGHKLLNFLLHKFVKNVSTCRPRLGYPASAGLCLCPHKSLVNKAVYLLCAICDPTGNRTLITGLKTRCPNR